MGLSPRLSWEWVSDVFGGSSTEYGTALIAFIGGLLGAGAVVGAQWLQHRQTVEHEKAREARARAVRAAEEIDRLLIQLESLVPQVAAATNVRADAASTEFSSTEQIRFLCVHLPVELRRRVEQAVTLLRDADDIAGNRSTCPHYHSVSTIARNVVEDAREGIAAFLRNEQLPEESDYMIEYAESHRELQNDLEDFYAEEIDSQHEAREAWLARHPAVKEQLERRQHKSGR